jgi:hypothetical protein
MKSDLRTRSGISTICKKCNASIARDRRLASSPPSAQALDAVRALLRRRHAAYKRRWRAKRRAQIAQFGSPIPHRDTPAAVARREARDARHRRALRRQLRDYGVILSPETLTSLRGFVRQFHKDHNYYPPLYKRTAFLASLGPLPSLGRPPTPLDNLGANPVQSGSNGTTNSPDNSTS